MESNCPTTPSRSRASTRNEFDFNFNGSVNGNGELRHPTPFLIEQQRTNPLRRRTAYCYPGSGCAPYGNRNKDGRCHGSTVDVKLDDGSRAGAEDVGFLSVRLFRGRNRSRRRRGRDVRRETDDQPFYALPRRGGWVCSRRGRGGASFWVRRYSYPSRGRLRPPPPPTADDDGIDV